MLLQFERLGHVCMVSPLFLMKAGADLYTVAISVEPHSGHRMWFSVFSAIVALIFDSFSQLLHFRS